MFFNTLLMVVSMLAAICMARSTKKTGKDFSNLPSRMIEDHGSTSAGSNKKGPAQNDESFDSSRTVEFATVTRFTRCNVCGESLSRVSVIDYERRTRLYGVAQVSMIFL